MTPILQRMYQSEGGSEICDVLMKYLYKGMAQGAPTTTATGSPAGGRNITPQATGFSQAGGRSFGSAEGGMSVLLSWHEKV
jgi:actin related protein 2/3 complex, subunit 5